MLDFNIDLGLNAVKTAGLASHKSRFIYHFRIADYQEESTSDGGLVK